MMMTYEITSAFVSSAFDGHAACPGSETDRDERLAAEGFRPSVGDFGAASQDLVARRAVPSLEAGLVTSRRDQFAVKNRARRTVFRLLGVYLPEPKALELLRRIHEFKWIEAEKAGFDIWRPAAKVEPVEPFVIAARTWAQRYLPKFLNSADSNAPMQTSHAA